MSLKYRLTAPRDEWAIAEALLKLKHYAEKYDWAVDVDYDIAFDNIIQACAAGKGYVVDGYLVMIDVVTPWYSQSPVLQEWLVLKIFDVPNYWIDSVPVALRQIAQANNCAVIITADSSPVSIVAKAYQRAGYKPLTQSFFTKV